MPDTSRCPDCGSYYSGPECPACYYGELDPWEVIDESELEALVFDSVVPACCSHGCQVEPDGICPHGCRSVLLVLGVI